MRVDPKSSFFADVLRVVHRIKAGLFSYSFIPIISLFSFFFLFLFLFFL